MREREYEIMRACEDVHWWYRGLRNLIDHELSGFPPQIFRKIADIGCGTGGNLSFLAQRFKKAFIMGLDLHPEALRFSKLRRERAGLVQGSGNDLPFGPEHFDLVIFTDVLYIREIDEKRALQEILRVLKPGGILLLNVPAFECLRGSHDEAVHTRRRYRRQPLKEQLASAGFCVQKIFYWNALFFPLVFFKRQWSLLLRKDKPQSDLEGGAPRINRFLTQSIFLEQRLSRRGIFPFGTSLFSVCKK